MNELSALLRKAPTLTGYITADKRRRFNLNVEIGIIKKVLDFFYPLIGWGIGISAHYLCVFVG